MRFSRAIALMLIVGFVGFLGSVFTGSLALAAVAAGFFGGATCGVVLLLADKQADTPSEEPEEEQEEIQEPTAVGRSKYGGAL